MKIKRIFIPKGIIRNNRVRQIIRRFQPQEIVKVRDLEEANKYLEQFEDPLAEGKHSLFLRHFPGKFLEPCPCTREYVRCGYWILSPVVGCPIDCSYCILQGYLNSYPLQVYLNLEDMFKEIKKWETLHPQKRIRLGTGELADSLALEPELGYAKELIKFFENHPRCLFEFKTKTTYISSFREFKPKENIIISWSVNPESAVQTEEKGSAGIEARLESAQILSERGWQVGFHFDPILPEYGLENYLKLVEQIFHKVKPEKIKWFSLGTLRFPHQLKPIIKSRHPFSRILSGEMFPGKDNKLRYLRPLREKFYSAIIQKIREYAPKSIIYLCMEPESLWEKNHLSIRKIKMF